MAIQNGKTLKEVFEKTIDSELKSYFGDKQNAVEMAKEVVHRFAYDIIKGYLEIDSWGEPKKDGKLYREIEKQVLFDFSELVKEIKITQKQKNTLQKAFEMAYYNSLEKKVIEQAEKLADEEFWNMQEFNSIPAKKYMNNFESEE